MNLNICFYLFKAALKHEDGDDDTAIAQSIR
jgi:hypothetical protein